MFVQPPFDGEGTHGKVHMKSLILGATLAVLISAMTWSPWATAQDASKRVLSDKQAHVFVEEGILFGMIGNRLLSVDLANGGVSLSAPQGKVVDSKIKVRDVPLDWLGRGIVWLGSIELDGSKTGSTSDGGDNSLDMVGGSWQLTYEHLRWQARQSRGLEKSGDNCGSELFALISTVVAVISACESGGSGGCDGALDELHDAFNDYLRCMDDYR